MTRFREDILLGYACFPTKRNLDNKIKCPATARFSTPDC